MVLRPRWSQSVPRAVEHLLRSLTQDRRRLHLDALRVSPRPPRLDPTLLLDGDLASAEPKRLRFCLLHTAAVIVRRSRQRWLRLPDSWPWTTDLVAAFNHLGALTAPT